MAIFGLFARAERVVLDTAETRHVWRAFAADVHARKIRCQSFLHVARDLSEDELCIEPALPSQRRLVAVYRHGLGAVSGVDRDSNA